MFQLRIIQLKHHPQEGMLKYIIDMYEYKDLEFYNNYFSQLANFRLVQEFVDSDDGKALWDIINSCTELSSLGHNDKNHIRRKFDNLNIFIGVIEVIGTIYPIRIVVQIPKTFPHHRLMFYTASISGYPHLISNSPNDISYLDIFTHEKYASWFCLNTPFAETAESQLDIEVERLDQWIEKQICQDLPAHITDSRIIKALRIANAYSWENVDEMNEYRHDAQLTFIGDYGKTIDSIQETIGVFECIKNESNNFYITSNCPVSNYKLPYIIVDELPTDYLKDFVLLKKHFKWDVDTCNNLMKGRNAGEVFREGNVESGNARWDYVNEHCSADEKENVLFKYSNDVDIPEDEANRILDEGIRTVNLDFVPQKHRVILEGVINKTRENIKENHCYLSDRKRNKWLDKPVLNDEDDYEEDPETLYYIEQYECTYFALGIKTGNDLTWCLMSSQRCGAEYKTHHYDLGLISVDILELVSYKLYYELAQHFSEKEFWGRGKFGSTLSDKKIAIFGVGVIGSMLAETLARSGVKYIGLWDSDLVEPGNICRGNFSISDLGNNKVSAIKSRLHNISPFCKVITHGFWDENGIYKIQSKYTGDFYGNINYKSQKEELDKIKEYDLVIDCTANNELLHFLSYSLKDKDVISLCITNMSKDLVCVSNRDGNLFEIRKMFLSRIEQDTKNYYIEGTGCYSPTFKAKHCDIAALVNLAIRDLDGNFENNGLLIHSTIWSYKNCGIIADRLRNFHLEGYESIKLSISDESIFDCIDLNFEVLSNANGSLQLPILGYALGCYSLNREHIFITHIISTTNAETILKEKFDLSYGVIDYVGDVCFSTNNNNLRCALIDMLATKAQCTSINTNNPLLIFREENDNLAFYLYIDNQLVRFIED